MIGITAEFCAERRVLRGDATRTGIEMAYAHHDAAHRDEWRGGETELLCAEQGGNGDVAAGFELAIGLHDDAGAKVIKDESLVGLGEAKFPRYAGVFDTGLRGSAGAAIVTADEDDIRMGFSDAGGDGADADFSHKFDADASVMVCVFEVVDQLGQILDGINIVVRRRRYQSHSRCRKSDLGNGRENL